MFILSGSLLEKILGAINTVKLQPCAEDMMFYCACGCCDGGCEGCAGCLSCSGPA